MYLFLCPLCLLPWTSCLACYRLCVERLLDFHRHIWDIFWNFGCMISGVPKFSKIFEVLLAYMVFQYSFDSSVSVWYFLLLNVFYFFAYLSLNAVSLTLLWIFVCDFFSFGVILAFNYWLDIFRLVGIGVFLNSCMSLQYYLLEGWLFFCYVHVFMLGMAT